MRLADVLRRFGPHYRARFGDRMLPSHRRALDDIIACRTPDCGSHLEACDACGHHILRVHSCRNRHCPTCQGDRARAWLDRHLALLLPCRYFLVTITVPADLRPLFRRHQRLAYDLLLREAARAVLDLCANPDWLGARPAILAVLHTWARNLAYHPHVHLLVSAGGLLGDAWLMPRNPNFLVPGFVLQARLRTRLRAAFRAAGFDTSAAFWWSDWIAHVKRLRSGDLALAYLARYLFRVAISDRAILSAEHDHVRFLYVDARTGDTRRPVLTSHDFIARFLAHVLPRGFVKVRSYGLWASASRSRLDLARSLLNIHRSSSAVASTAAAAATDHHGDLGHRRCPACRVGRMVTVEVFPRPRPPP